MFDVLMYLFETYIHSEAEMRVDQDKLTRDLTDAGFEREDIYNALMWLEKLADYQEGLVEPMQLASDPLSLRVYTEEECQRLDASCRGFLLFLEQHPACPLVSLATVGVVSVRNLKTVLHDIP